MSYPIRRPDPGQPLPLRQAQLLAFIKSKKHFPTAREMADHMGWKNETSAFDCLHRLAWRGKVERRSDGWRLINAPDAP